MSKVNVYDKKLQNALVINDDGSINVKGAGLSGGGSAGEVKVDVGDVKVEVPERKLVLKKSFTLTESEDFRLGEDHHFIAIANDCEEGAVLLSVHDMVIKVLPWESFEAEFNPFQDFEIEMEGTGEVRVVVFKKKTEDDRS